MNTSQLSLQLPNYYATEHFMYSDVACPCCDRIRIIPALYRHLGLLETLRNMTDVSFIITSGYRCPDHNHAVGGAPHSWHLLFATDIQPEHPSPDQLQTLYQAAKQCGFSGIGRYDTHLHLDLRSETAYWRG